MMRFATVIASMMAFVACARREVATPAPSAVTEATPAPAPAAALPDDLEPAASDDRADGGAVTIRLQADPHRQARVFWGRKDLGVAPLEIVRPRGSAPLDLTIQSPQCLPLHTRVFTDRDDTLSLRFYTEREAVGLPGYSPTTAVTPPAAAKKPGQF